MIIQNVSYGEVLGALSQTNQLFDDNVSFQTLKAKGYGGYNAHAFTVTLRVRDSHGLGARVGFTGRAMIAACWHAHGVFFSYLPMRAVMIADGRKFNAHSKWENRNFGSKARPLMYSNACKCSDYRDLMQEIVARKFYCEH